MASYAMSPVDAAWYHMDGPENLAMVTGVLLTKRPLDFDRVRAVYRERLAQFERFRQRVVEGGFPLPTPHWEDVPHFDMDQHLHHVALPAPHDQAALRALITDIASTPLDREQPLWQVHVVDKVEGGSALAMRFHHCIADGTAMLSVMQKLFDPAPGTRQTEVPVLKQVTAPLGIVDKAALVVSGAGMLIAEVLKWPDPQSPLKGEFGMRKHVAWSAPVAIKDVKAIGAQHGAKVNDVLVAAMTGALRTYLKGRGIDVNHTTVRAMVPVDLRPPERLGQMGNEFGLVILELAVTKSRWAQRLALTKERMDALKRSTEPMAMRVLLDIFGRTPKAVEDLANQVFGSKTSLVLTNVAGPRNALYLAGVAIDRMLFWVPHPGRQLGMGISIMSYRGKATLAVIADARLVPDPEAITAEFNREFASMLRSLKPQATKPAVKKSVKLRV